MPRFVTHMFPLLQGGKGERGPPGITGSKGEKGERVSVPSCPMQGPSKLGVLPVGVLLPPMASRPWPCRVQAEPLSCLPAPAGR